MAIVLLIGLALLCGGICVDGMRNPARVYQFPFCAAAVFAGFIVPPLFGLLSARYFPQWALERFLIMCILCLLMCWLGDSLARKRGPMKTDFVVYDSPIWLLAATVLILAGGAAYVKNRSLFQMEFEMYAGLPVALNFFVVLLRYGFVMALVHFLHTRNRYALLLLCLGVIYYLDRAVLFGRRTDTIEFGFAIVGAVWFVLHKPLPRVVIVNGVILTALLIASIGAYRSVVVSPSGERDWSRLKNVNVFDEFRKANVEGSSETISGIFMMAAAATDQAFDFGLFHWNMFVFNYVPAQVVGADFKQAMDLPIPDLTEISAREYGFTPPNGSTVTGMVDCYASFWYFGCAKFFLIAYIMQLLYVRAVSGGIMAQVIYLFMMCMAMGAITHHTQWFFSPWVHMLFFWIPLMLYSKWAGTQSRQLALET